MFRSTIYFMVSVYRPKCIHLEIKMDDPFKFDENSIMYANYDFLMHPGSSCCSITGAGERINIDDEEHKVNRVKSRVKCASFMEIDVV